MKMTRLVVGQLVLLGIGVLIIGFDVARTWKRDVNGMPLMWVGIFVCLAAAFLPAFRRKS